MKFRLVKVLGGSLTASDLYDYRVELTECRTDEYQALIAWFKEWQIPCTVIGSANEFIGHPGFVASLYLRKPAAELFVLKWS